MLQASPAGLQVLPPAPAPNLVGVQSEEGLDVKELLSGAHPLCWEAAVLS